MTDLSRVVAWLDDARTAIADRLEQQLRPDDVVALMRATKLINAAITAVQAAMPVCGSRYGFSAHCRLTAGHAGKHAAGNIRWTDAEGATSTAAIAATLDGRRD